MRIRKRADQPVNADGTASCHLCGQAVPVQSSGLCTLGHRVTSPEIAARAVGHTPHSSDTPSTPEVPAAPQPELAPDPRMTTAETDRLFERADLPAPQAVEQPTPAQPLPVRPKPAPRTVDDADQRSMSDLLDFERAGSPRS